MGQGFTKEQFCKMIGWIGEIDVFRIQKISWANLDMIGEYVIDLFKIVLDFYSDNVAVIKEVELILYFISPVV